MTTVAVVTSQPADQDWVIRELDGKLELVDAAPLAGVIVVSEDRLDAIAEQLPATAKVVVLGDPAAPPERATHVVTRAWPPGQLLGLVAALGLDRPAAPDVLPPPSTPADALYAQRAVAAARKLSAAANLASCETTAVDVVMELLELDRAYCLYFDGPSGSLWSEAKLEGPAGDDRRAVTGLAGFAALTGLTAVAQRAGEDPRFVGAIDDPEADPTDRVIAQPVFGSDGAIHAVLIGARRGRRAAFGRDDLAVLDRFARLVTPVLDQLSITVHAQAILDDAAGEGLFRREAMESHEPRRWGDVVRVSPGWLSWAYWLLVALLVGSAVFVAVGKVSTYSTGPAVIQSTARTLIIARTSGNVVAVEVAPERTAVTAGMVIARLDDSDQRAEATRLERDLETQLRNHMLDPGDAAAEASVRDARNRLETARTAMGERLIRTTVAGTIGDVRVRPGQHVEPGDIIASVVDAGRGLEVIALLPGEDRPQLKPGMTMRLELTGYRYTYQTVVIDSVSPDVIAPTEARRVLGAEVAEGMALTRSVVLVHGRLATTQFVVDGQTYRYHDGMLGTAEVSVRDEPIVFVLVPGTRRFQ